MKKPTLFEDYYNISATTENDGSALRIPLGVSGAGVLEEVAVKADHCQHILVAGHAGCGKSSYLHTVLGSLLLNYTAKQVNIWLSDGGTCEFNHLVCTPPAQITRVNTSCESKECVDFMDALAAEVRRRIRHLAAVETSSFYKYCGELGEQPFPRLVVMIDGFEHFVRCLTKADYDNIYKLESVMRYAATCGVTVIVTIQEMERLSADISQDLLAQFGIRIATLQSYVSYGMLFGCNTIQLTRELMFGEAVVNTPTVHKVDRLYLDHKVEAQILRIV